jgi:STE24 endopeptidase
MRTRDPRSVARLACSAALSLSLALAGAAGAVAGPPPAAAAAAPPAAGAPAASVAAPPAAGTPASSSSAAPASPPPASSAPPPAAAAGNGFDPVAATDAYLARVTPQQRARSDAYFEGGYWLQLWGFLYGVGIVVLLLASGLSARMRDLAERWFSARPAQTFTYAVQYLLVSAVLSFPLAVYADFFRERRYGLATQKFGAWFVERLEGLGLEVVIGGIAIAILYGVLRRAPRTWWIWGAVVAILLLAVLMLLSPVFVEPIFNRYTELRDPAVRNPILALARANGVPAQHVYMVDASRQTTRVSGNVAGLLGTTRIALNDNLLRRCTVPEIEAVMGHEMGHYVLHHVSKGLLFLGVVVVAAFAFVQAGFGRVLGRWGAGWGVRDLADPAGLPLLVLLLSVFLFVLTPVLNTFTRGLEAEADIFGLNAARQPDGEAEVALKLGEYRKLSPGPVEEWIFYDHPSGRTRILTAMRWKAEHLGEPPICRR